MQPCMQQGRMETHWRAPMLTAGEAQARMVTWLHDLLLLLLRHVAALATVHLLLLLVSRL